MTALKFESGIPIPPRKRFNPAYDKMKPGQCTPIFEEYDPAFRFYQNMRNHFLRHQLPFSSTIRKVDGGWRVWKVKAE